MVGKIYCIIIYHRFNDLKTIVFLILLHYFAFFLVSAGFDFPRGPGAYAPRFCFGPLYFPVMGPKKV